MPLGRLICTVFFFALSLITSSAYADSFVYSIANHFTGFQVDGTITTDTNAGVLSYADITDFNLLITSGGVSDTLTYSNSDNAGLYGYGLTATSTGLFFDYDQPFAVLVLNNTSTGTYLCYQTDGCDYYTSPRESVRVGYGASSAESQTGNVQIGTIEATAITPEPSSLVLLASGLTAAFVASRFRQLAG